VNQLKSISSKILFTEYLVKVNEAAKIACPCLCKMAGILAYNFTVVGVYRHFTAVINYQCNQVNILTPPFLLQLVVQYIISIFP